MSLPPPPPDAWGNRPGHGRREVDGESWWQTFRRRVFREAYHPFDEPFGSSITNFYGERLASSSKQFWAAVIDSLLVILLPVTYSIDDITGRNDPYYYYGESHGIEGFTRLPWVEMIGLSLIFWGVLIAAFGASIGMALLGLHACEVVAVPGSKEQDGGYYFVVPTGGQAFKYAFLHFFECFFVFAGMSGIKRSKYAQSWAASRAEFVLLEDVWLVRFFRREHLGPNRKSVAPIQEKK